MRKPIMANSSVFIFLVLRTLYRMICKSSKTVAKKSLNVPNVKLLSISGFFMPCHAQHQKKIKLMT